MSKSKEPERSTTNKQPIFEKGSGNVFIDLGFPEDEAVNLVARCQLMNQIEDIIKSHSWTQEEAAKFLGVRQPRVSDLMTGRIEKFTVDTLMKWLHKLGKEVSVNVKDREVA